MLEQDYLMRIFLQFAEILRRSWFKARDEHDPKAAADMLENAVGEATDIDGATLLSLAPESMAGILQVSGTDPRVIEYVARGLMLASFYLREAGDGALADVRLEQARALADAYGIEVPDDPAELVGLAEEGYEAAEAAIVDIAGAEEGATAPMELPLDPAEEEALRN